MSDCGRGNDDRRSAAVELPAGEAVLVGSRRATFLYLIPGEDAAVVRYTQQARTCVVPAHKLAAVRR